MNPSPAAPDQFLQVVRQAEPRLLRMAQRMAGQREVAQDLVQEAVLKGWEMVKAGRLEIGPGTESWLRQATAHAFLNWRRRESKRKTDELDELHEPADHDPMQQPQQRLEHLDRMEWLRQGLNEISEDHCAIIALVDLEAMSYQEAAAVLNLPTGTVRSRLSRARVALANALLRLRPEMDVKF